MGRKPRNSIERLRTRIDAAENIGEQDQELLNTFSQRLDLLNQTYTDHRHAKLLRHVTIIAEQLEDDILHRALHDRDEAEVIVAWINRTYDNEETNRDYRTAVRVFGKRVAEREGGIETGRDGRPLTLDWIPTGTSSNYDPTPDPRDMVTWEEAHEMIEATFNTRDAAMIALQFDAGLRGGEFKAMKVGDVQDHRHGLQITVEGKQGRRSVMLIPSVPYVNQWLSQHPARSDRDAPLWCKLEKPETMSSTMFSKAFRQAAERADIQKPVTLTNFRKSSAAFLASRNLNQAHIEDHHGWVRGSRAAARYISVFGEAADRELAKLHGIDVSEDEPDHIGPIPCPRCRQDTPREEAFCINCGQAMQPDSVAAMETKEGELMETLASLEGDTAQRLVELANALDDPDVRMQLLGD